jgi:hypothetical protein
LAAQLKSRRYLGVSEVASDKGRHREQLKAALLMVSHCYGSAISA